VALLFLFPPPGEFSVPEGNPDGRSPVPLGQYECHGNFFTFSSKGNQQQAPPVMGPNPKNFKGKFCPITWDELNSGKEIPKSFFDCGGQSCGIISV
jgi:hypothetical protein